MLSVATDIRPARLSLSLGHRIGFTSEVIARLLLSVASDVRPARLGLGFGVSHRVGVTGNVPRAGIVLLAELVRRSGPAVGLLPDRCPGWLGLGLALEDLFGGRLTFAAVVRGGDLLCDGRRSERSQSDRAEKVAEKHCRFACLLVSVYAVVARGMEMEAVMIVKTG